MAEVPMTRSREMSDIRKLDLLGSLGCGRAIVESFHRRDGSNPQRVPLGADAHLFFEQM